MPYSRLCLLLIFCCCHYLLLTAQNPHPHFRNYTTDDGLPSSEIHFAMQDTAGYMWFGTDNGLSRFDGYSFKNYGPAEGLQHSVIFFMDQDTDGKIWLATMSGELYTIEKDSIQAFAHSHVIKDEVQSNSYVMDFHIDKQGNKYLGLWNKVQKIFPNGEYQLFTPTKRATTLLFVKSGSRWVSCCSNYKAIWARAMENPPYYTPDKYYMEVFGDTHYFLPTIRLGDRIRSTVEGTGIIELDNGQIFGIFRSVFFEVTENIISREVKIPFVMSAKAIFEDTQGRLLFGLLRSGGLRRYKNLDAVFDHRFEQFLEGVSVTHIFQDRDGGYWISTLENGVFYSSDFELKTYDESTGFSHHHVVTLDFKNDQEAYVGFRNGAIVLFDFAKNKMTERSVLPGGILHDVFYDTLRKKLWVTDGLLHCFENNNWNTPWSEGLTINKRLTIGRDNQLLWGASHAGFGYMELNEKKSSFSLVSPSEQYRTLRVWEDQQHRIWVGNVNGLFEFKDEQLIPAAPDHKAFQTRVEDIGEMSDGTLVIATKGVGLLFWKDDFFYQIRTKDGLTSDMLENVFVDEKDQVWAGSLVGLNRVVYDGESFEVENITMFHGLPSNEITRVISHQEQIWIATTKGLVAWNEKEPSAFSAPPIVGATLVNNQVHDLSTNNRLNYDENNIEFHFVTINYKNNGNISYRFRFNDKTWTHTQNRVVNLFDLPPAIYEFEVQSQNENGMWSTSSIVDFEVRPALWQNWWFKLFWIIGLLGAIVLFFVNRIRNLQQAAKVEQEMNELKRSALRSQMNPHFIFNCLNSIQNFIVQNDQKNATRYLAKFAQLVRGTLKASIEETISLEEEVRLLEHYLNLEKLRFKERFNFSIHVDELVDEFEIELPPLLTQPFVENAILHGFADIKSGGQLDVKFKTEGQKLLISIRDNGRGIEQSKKQRKNDRKGVGIQISRQRLALADVLNEWTVEEVVNDQGEVQGTLVSMVLMLTNMRHS